MGDGCMGICQSRVMVVWGDGSLIVWGDGCMGICQSGVSSSSKLNKQFEFNTEWDWQLWKRCSCSIYFKYLQYMFSSGCIHAFVKSLMRAPNVRFSVVRGCGGGCGLQKKKGASFHTTAQCFWRAAPPVLVRRRLFTHTVHPVCFHTPELADVKMDFQSNIMGAIDYSQHPTTNAIT